MDWIEKKQSSSTKVSRVKSKTKSSASLRKQVAAALAQPTSVWSAAFDHSLAGIRWPTGCDVQSTWLWSAVIQEQAEVMVRAGVSAVETARVIDPVGRTDEKSLLASISGLMHQPLQSVLPEWLDQSDAYPQAALGTVITLWHLPEHARRNDPAILSNWVALVAEQIDHRSGEHSDCLLGNLVFHCELPLLLDLLTANPSPCAGIVVSRAMDDLAEYLENSQQHIEAWLAHGAAYLRSALASVFRCRILADHYGLRSWYPPQRKALSGLLECAAQWARSNGTQLLGFSQNNKRAAAIWKALSKMASSPKSSMRTLSLAGLTNEKPREGTNRNRLPALALHSELAQCATMRHSWFHRGCGLALDFSESCMQLEAVGTKGTGLLKGEWPVHVALEGQIQYQMDGWEEICWFSDEDLDYIELEAKFGENARVQRQLVLFRKDRYILAADALLCNRQGQWTMQSELALSEGVQWEPSAKNTEGFLIGNQRRCVVIPLFLPEWKSQAMGGSLHMKSNTLMVSNSSLGTACIYSPVVIGLANRLASHPYTWRQLTVAENLGIVGRDQAAAFRLQFGKKQFLFYRNLSKATKRTVLGVHLMSDFFAGQIDKDSGEADSLVEIDAA